MTVQSLFKQRSTIYMKQLSRYMKYVLNDHFVLALLLLLGAAGFGYSNYIQTVQTGEFIPRLVLLILMTGAISIGNISTLLQQADRAFLLPLESELYPILKKAVWKSMMILALPLAFVSIAAMPLLASTMATVQLDMWPIFVATTIMLKIMDLNIEFMTYFVNDSTKRTTFQYLAKCIMIIGLASSLFINLLIGFVFSILVALLSLLLIRLNKQQHKSLQWDYVISREENRQQAIYRFINLFTEVSFIESHPKRLKVLDKLIALQSSRNKEIHYYYIVRTFYRNPSFSGLVIRLTLIGMLFFSFDTAPGLDLVIGLLFLYLIGFQLIPIYQQFKQNFYFQLYPIEETGKIKSIQRLITEVLAAVLLLFIGVSLFKSLFSSGLILIGGSLFIGLFTRLYLPKRLYRMEQY
ncbi:ABC transporter permease [Marinilactibacillus kalidii]|uniref:ABC transporter permease n=1 Tax=Marinilactibacillus kalidii TaxID=2820274 RepID=UPI001ABED23C|nr:ABC transporter permease [Marinilactibacillus kalidii]